jgi:hypothetical protein
VAVKFVIRYAWSEAWLIVALHRLARRFLCLILESRLRYDLAVLQGRDVDIAESPHIPHEQTSVMVVR